MRLWGGKRARVDDVAVEFRADVGVAMGLEFVVRRSYLVEVGGFGKTFTTLTI